MGAGSSLEAAYSLRGPIPAGTWRLVADGLVFEPVDVTFELIWRSDAGDETFATFTHHFDPLPAGEYRAQPYEVTAEAAEIAAAPGDELVLRFTGDSENMAMAYIPNGDGELTEGRIPFVDLPQ